MDKDKLGKLLGQEIFSTLQSMADSLGVLSCEDNELEKLLINKRFEDATELLIKTRSECLSDVSKKLAKLSVTFQEVLNILKEECVN